MKTLMIILMLIFSTTVFSSESLFDNNKIWFDFGLGGEVGDGTELSTNLSLNFISNNHIHFKISAINISDNEESDLGINRKSYYGALIGYQMYSGEHTNISILGGLGITEIYINTYDPDQKKKPYEDLDYQGLSIPLELEFMADLSYVGLGLSLFVNINPIAPTFGALFKIAFGKL